MTVCSLFDSSNAHEMKTDVGIGVCLSYCAVCTLAYYPCCKFIGIVLLHDMNGLVSVKNEQAMHRRTTVVSFVVHQVVGCVYMNDMRVCVSVLFVCEFSVLGRQENGELLYVFTAIIRKVYYATCILNLRATIHGKCYCTAKNSIEIISLCIKRLLPVVQCTTHEAPVATHTLLS